MSEMITHTDFCMRVHHRTGRCVCSPMHVSNREGFCDECGVRGDNASSIVRHGIRLDLCRACLDGMGA